MLPGLPFGDAFGGIRLPLHGITNAISWTVWPFLRKEPGRRFLTIGNIIGAFAVARIYEIACHWFGLFPESGQLYLFTWFVYSFTTLNILSFVFILVRERAWQQGRLEDPVHSMYHGTSWLSYIPQLEQWGFNQRRVLRFLEPSCVLVVGMGLRPFDPVTGTWLIIAAVALFIKNNIVIHYWIERQRDLMDARIESGYMHHTTTRPQAGQQQGHTVRPHLPPVHHSLHDGDGYGIDHTVREVMGDTTGQDAQAQSTPRVGDEDEEVFDGDDDVR